MAGVGAIVRFCNILQVSLVSTTLFGVTQVKYRSNVHLTISSTSVWMPEITAAASSPSPQITKTIRVKELWSHIKKMKPLWINRRRPRADGYLICGGALLPFAVRCLVSNTGQRSFEIGPFLPWQSVFKQRKWVSHKPWIPKNNKWQWHFTAAATLRPTWI